MGEIIERKSHSVFSLLILSPINAFAPRGGPLLYSNFQIFSGMGLYSEDDRQLEWSPRPYIYGVINGSTRRVEWSPRPQTDGIVLPAGSSTVQNGARRGTRTPTSFDIRPSNVRGYQLHHPRNYQGTFARI